MLKTQPDWQKELFLYNLENWHLGLLKENGSYVNAPSLFSTERRLVARKEMERQYEEISMPCMLGILVWVLIPIHHRIGGGGTDRDWTNLLKSSLIDRNTRSTCDHVPVTKIQWLLVCM